jgi:hypothetical protein
MQTWFGWALIKPLGSAFRSTYTSRHRIIIGLPSIRKHDRPTIESEQQANDTRLIGLPTEKLAAERMLLIDPWR